MSQQPRTKPSETAPGSIPHWYTAGTEPVTIVDGDGACVYDDDGTEYLDFVSQLYCVNAGHGEDRITDAITDQLERVAYVSSAKDNDTRTELAARLAEVAPGSLSDVYFSVTGSEANESAVQLAREYTGGQKILTRWRSYHGGTYGAGSLTGDPETRSTLERHAATTGAGKFLPPLPRAFDGATGEELAERAANHLEFVIRNEGPDSIAAILSEPVAGTSGAYPAPAGYFERVRELCEEYDILLISDEVIAGFGRCGDWFGIQTEDVEPDMITFAKGVTSAYVPLAGVLVSEEIGDWAREHGTELGQTFAGHPVGCAAGLAAMDVYEDGLIENVRTLEPHLGESLQALEERYDAVHSVHGRGFLWGVEFADPETGEHFFDPRVDEAESDDDHPVKAVRTVAQDNGVMFGGGRPDVQLIVSPPLCTTEAELDEAVSVLEEAIETVFD